MEKAAESVHVWPLLERVLDFIVMEIKLYDSQYPLFNFFFPPECSLLPSSQVVSKEHPDTEKM